MACSTAGGRNLAALATAVVMVAASLVACGDVGGRESATTSRPNPGGNPPVGDAPEASTTPDGVPTSTASPGGCDARARIAGWPRRDRLAALVVVGVDPTGPEEATRLVEDDGVGGVFVGGNDTGLLRSGALKTLAAEAPLGLLVAVDEEGGRVQRIEAIAGDVPSARQMADTMTPPQVRDLAERRGRAMAALGVNVDLAPVVDVSDQPALTVIGDRSWSDDPEVVVDHAGAYAEGLLAAGVTPVLKHFPGHGSASGDTHQGAATTPPLDELTERDLVPYAELTPRLGTRAAVMLGHLDVPGLTEPGHPASISAAAVRLLRDGYDFDGVVMTDDLAGMAAITDRMTPAQAAVAALAAGADMVLFAHADVTALLDEMEAAVADGTIPSTRIDEAVHRTLDLKGVDPCTVAG